MNTSASTPSLVSTDVSLLHSRAVLVRLFTGAFIGNPQDKILTTEVENDHNISTAKRISVRKKIMQGAELNAVSAALQRVRITAEKLSAPWLDGGLRIVKASSLIDAKLAISKEIRDFEATVDAFIDAYDTIIQRDRIALNGTFRLTDYPSKNTLRAKFSARLEVLPLPSSDFRVEGIAQSVCEELAREMENNTLARVNDAKRDLISRIREKVAALATKLATMGDNSRFHDSSVTGIKDACANVRAVNFDDDQGLNELTERIESAVSGLSPELIRDNKGAQAEALTVAKQALTDLESAMAGFVM